MENLYTAENIENGLEGDYGFCDPGDYLTKVGMCYACFTESSENVVLKTCSRCNLIQYCSRECQKADFDQHKIECKKVKKMTDLVDRLGARLHSIKCLNWPRQNLFKTMVGRFWGLLEPRDYCRARYQLADHIFLLGQDHDLKRPFEVALSHYMELMRLSHGDNQGVRDKVPFVLLRLDRDQDAYDFIKWWETIDSDGDYDWGNPPPSKEGDWLYLRGENILEDIFEFADIKYTSLSFVAALILIKARIVLRMELSLGRFCLFKKCLENGNDTCQKLLNASPVMDKIEKMLPHDKEEISRQMILLKKYIDIADKRNKNFLKVVNDPTPLLDMDPPRFIQMGTMSELYYVVGNCAKLFARNAILMRIIREKLRVNPKF